jgi:hypothetical protein
MYCHFGCSEGYRAACVTEFAYAHKIIGERWHNMACFGVFREHGRSNAATADNINNCHNAVPMIFFGVVMSMLVTEASGIKKMPTCASVCDGRG